VSAENAIVTKLQDAFPGDILEWSDFRGDLAVVVAREKILPVLEMLKIGDGLQFAMLLDLCGVDHPGRGERFEVVYHLLSLQTRHRVRIKVRVPEQDPVVDSAASLFKAANWFEREAYDMFGIQFRGHPYLRRLLCHEDFEGHALRKDHDSKKRTRCTRVIALDPDSSAAPPPPLGGSE
jgi:NADH/F420H2 dehydrogenase subunit C